MVRQDNVVPNINMDSGTTGTPAVRNLHALEANRDGYTSTTHTEAGGTTGTPAVVTYMVVKQAAQIHISYGYQAITNTYVSTITKDNGTTKSPLVQCLPSQEANRDKYGCCTYATTEASYIRKTVSVPNTNTNVGMDGTATNAPLPRHPFA